VREPFPQVGLHQRCFPYQRRVQRQAVAALVGLFQPTRFHQRQQLLVGRGPAAARGGREFHQLHGAVGLAQQIQQLQRLQYRTERPDAAGFARFEHGAASSSEKFLHSRMGSIE